MEQGPRRLLVQEILDKCLSAIRRYGELPASEFAEATAHLTSEIRDLANQLDSPSPESGLRSELPGWEGYALWAESYDSQEYNPVVDGDEEVIWDVVGNVRGQRVLDVGCGTGRHAVPLAAQGAEVVGVEPELKMLERARQAAEAQGLRIDLRQGKIANLSPDLGAFDLVLCCLVLTDVADLPAAVARLAEHVKPGGRLIVSDFHPFGVIIGWRTGFEAGGQEYVIPNYPHLPSDYFAAMENAGLAVARFFERGGVRWFPGVPMTLVMEARKPTRGR